MSQSESAQRTDIRKAEGLAGHRFKMSIRWSYASAPIPFHIGLTLRDFMALSPGCWLVPWMSAKKELEWGCPIILPWLQGLSWVVVHLVLEAEGLCVAENLCYMTILCCCDFFSPKKIDNESCQYFRILSPLLHRVHIIDFHSTIKPVTQEVAYRTLLYLTAG